MKIAGLTCACWKTLLIAFVLLIYREQATAQCAHLEVVSQSKSATAYQSAFYAINPATKYFLQRVGATTVSDSYDESDSSSSTHESGSETFTRTQVFRVGGSGQMAEDNTVGSATFNKTYSDSSGDGWSVNESGTDNNGTWSDGGQALGDAESYLFTIYYCLAYPYQCSDSTCVATVSCSDGGWTYKETDTWTYSVDAIPVVRDSAKSQIPAFNDQWSTNTANSCGSASFSSGPWSPNGGDPYGVTASCSRFEYFFHITDCQPHISYWVTWYEVTTYPNNQPPKLEFKFEEIYGNGDPVNGVDGTMHTVEVPDTPCTISETNIKMTYSVWDLLSGIPGF